jgi:hypothetical protein
VTDVARERVMGGEICRSRKMRKVEEDEQKIKLN